MAKKFTGKLATAAFQSTPKPGHLHISVKGSVERHVREDDTTSEASFVTVDDNLESPSEDSGICASSISSRSSPSDHPMDDSSLSSPSNSRIDEIGTKAQNLIEKINQSWAMDQKVMSSFEEKLMKKNGSNSTIPRAVLRSEVSDMCQQIKEQMFVFYEEQRYGMETRLQELSEVLKRSSQLSTELRGASQTLTAINIDLQHPLEQ